MVKKIEIDIPGYNAIINNKLCLINGKKIITKENDINNIIRIIRTWKTEYKNKFSEDIFTIKVITDTEEVLYKFNSEFPKDFNLLEKCMENIYDRK